MKKKNVLMMAMSLVLVAVIAVGGTLAYLSDTTELVQNTFVGSAGIVMSLDEAKVGDNGQALEPEERVTANNYTNILPNTDYDKDPTVHITQVPYGGIDVYVKITGVDSDAYTANVTLNSKLQKVDDSQGVDGLYKYNEGVTSPMDIVVFDGISFEYTVDGTEDTAVPTFNNITVKAYAIQTGVDNAQDLAEEALA